ncbi:MAG: cell division protein FtsZ [Bacteroidetes bacterium]|nr:cell division protein FtsZ [Bacteroidota bacterium]
MSVQFNLPKEVKNIIKVIGVGGGGSNAVNHMFKQGINGVDFVVCNTDLQALESSPVHYKLPIGHALTSGLGAGANPEIGEKAALESIEQVIEMLGVHTKMLFITAGMGGGTGTGAAPIIAKTAKDMGILTVGIVTTPFKVEGNKRKTFADAGLQRMKDSVDCLLVISNDKVMSLHGNQKFSNAFAHANDILTTAAKGIAEIITINGYINVDFEDVRTVMVNSGVAIIGTAQAEGEHRAFNAIETALNSPLLNDNKIRGAKNILLNIASGTEEALVNEIEAITEYIQRESEITTDIILGLTQDDSLGSKISVTVIATGFEPIENKPIVSNEPQQWIKRNLLDLEPSSKPVVDEVPNQFELFDQPSASENKVVENNERVEVNFEINNVDSSVESKNVAPANDNKVDNVNLEYIDKLKQRMMEMRTLSNNIRNPQTVDEMHSVPAYLRKAVNLDQLPHSSENNLSRTSLIEEKEEYKHELRQNNSFLHDNVD